MKIKIVKNGPYIVNGDVPLYKIESTVDEDKFPIAFENKEKIETDGAYSLCRCGHSKNLPFCDGTHQKVDFHGEEVASKYSYEKYLEIFEGERLKLIDSPGVCDHSRFCLRAGGIRSLIEKGDLESSKIAIEEASLCPSGRLTIYDKESDTTTEPKYEKEIVWIYDTGKDVPGPLWVKGGIAIESADGERYGLRNRVTLCRCGKSDNKPFCDGNHWMDEKHQKEFRERWNLDI